MALMLLTSRVRPNNANCRFLNPLKLRIVASAKIYRLDCGLLHILKGKILWSEQILRSPRPLGAVESTLTIVMDQPACRNEGRNGQG